MKTLVPDQVDDFRCISHRWVEGSESYVSEWENHARRILRIEYNADVITSRIPAVIRQMAEANYQTANVTNDEVLFDAPIDLR